MRLRNPFPVRLNERTEIDVFLSRSTRFSYRCDTFLTEGNAITTGSMDDNRMWFVRRRQLGLFGITLELSRFRLIVPSKADRKFK